MTQSAKTDHRTDSGAAAGAGAQSDTPSAKKTTAPTAPEKTTERTPKTPAKAKSTKTATDARKPAGQSTASPAGDAAPAETADSEALLSGVTMGMALYAQSLAHLQRTATCWTRYCADLAGAQDGMDILQAQESLMRERYDDIARDSIAAATLLLETGSEMADRILSDR